MENVDGMKFMIKGLVFVEFLVIKIEFIILLKGDVFVYLICFNQIKENVLIVQHNQLMTQLQKLAFAILDILKTSDYVSALVIIMNNLLMENVFVDPDTT